MSARAVTMYAVACDWRGCGAVSETVWAAASAVSTECDELSWDGWRDGRDGSHYCSGHPATWASDHESGEPFPDPPYLLIHDSDTDDRDDDGRVTYVSGDPS